MNDRELLERAARAYGLGEEWSFHAEFGAMARVEAGVAVFDEDIWNPLNDDGDALRLSNSSRLSICHTESPGPHGTVMIGRTPWLNVPPIAFEKYRDETERGAATRRAIVRAAAELCP